MQTRKTGRDRMPPGGDRRRPKTGPGIDADDRKATAEIDNSLELMRTVEHPGEFTPPMPPKADKGRHRD